MMYVFPVSTPASTAATAKLKTILPLARGKITRVDIQFPSGPSGYAHLALNRGLHQLYPTNPEGDFASDQETVWWTEDYDLDQEPLQLEAYSYNLDDTFAHTITVRVVLQPLPETGSFWQELKTLLTPGGA